MQTKEYREANKERISLKHKEYREKNKEKIQMNNKEYREKNKEKLKLADKKYYENNKKKRLEHSKEYREKNKEKLLEYEKEYRKENRKELLVKKKEYYERNKEKMLEINKKYRKENKAELDEYHKEYKRKKRLDDPNFRTIVIMRARLWSALKSQKTQKNNKTMTYVGCSKEELKIHLEKQFTEGMSWENYGKWHIDHIHPISKFNLTIEEEIHKAMHYTNLQPLWAEDNLRKKNFII